MAIARVPTSLERKINLGFTAAIIGLLLIGGAAWWSATRYAGTVFWVNHTQEVRGQLGRVLADVLGMQANARAYVLTGDESILQRYNASQEDILRSIDGLRALTADNAIQQDRIRRLEPVVAAVRAITDQHVAARRAHAFKMDAAGAFFLEDQAAVERIRVGIAAMESEEGRLFSDRLARMNSVGRLTVAAIVFAAVLAIGLVLVAGLMLRREAAQRVEMEKSIRENDERLRLVVSSVTDYAIILLDPSGHVMAWNPGAERIKGYTADEIIGKHFGIFFPADAQSAGGPEDALAKATAEGRLQDEGWRVRKDGTRFWASVVVTALRDPARRLMGFVKITRDLTERHEAARKIEALNGDLVRRAAQLEAANRELEAFSYSVSHDLRAPLRHIDGFAHLLVRKANASLDEEGRRYVDTISRAATQMGALIDDLLAFSRIGRTPMRFQPVDQRQLVQEVIADGRYDNTGRPIEWRIGELPAAQADPALLRQVWSNLIANAVKYSGKHPHPEISIGSHRDATKAECVYFVRDNGVGFDMAYVDKLFGVFQRLHGPTEFEGTGIGLANVRRIVSRHGGRTWAEGTVNGGATFYFSIPEHPGVSPSTA